MGNRFVRDDAFGITEARTRTPATASPPTPVGSAESVADNCRQLGLDTFDETLRPPRTAKPTGHRALDPEAINRFLQQNGIGL